MSKSNWHISINHSAIGAKICNTRALKNVSVHLSLFLFLFIAFCQSY